MPNVEIRRAMPGDERGMGFVNVTSWQTTYRGIVDNEFLQQLSIEQRTAHWAKRIQENHSNKVHLVAVSDNTIIGYCSGGTSREAGFDGEIYALYILQEWQHQGIGKQLTNQFFIFCTQYQFCSVCVWVLRDNPSRLFYESIGGKYKTSKQITIGSQHLEECLYVWGLHNISAIA
ncbi:MAG: GNAT family N-acetyltransferase [Candidatus Kapaibacterium sp.]|nr:GNAT family N-acetyltransferase [Bacteroidota bacterium]